MARARIESLEPRWLLTTLAPNLAFANDGEIKITPKKHGTSYYLDYLAKTDKGLLLSEDYYDGENPNYSLVRYTFAGRADKTYQNTALPTGSAESATAADATGRALYLGESTDNVVTISRYKVDGGLDTSFGKNGYAATALPTAPGATNVAYGEHPAIVAAPDGSMYVMAAAETYGPDHAATRGRALYLFRLTSRGRYDTAFGTVKVADVGDDGFKLLVDANGRALISSGDPARGRYTVVRYALTGQFDSTFARNGIYRLTGSPRTDYYSTTLDAQNRVLITRTTEKANVTRLTERGRVDATFATNGVAGDFTAVDGSERVQDTYAHPDGSVAILIQATGTGDTGNFIVRLRPDGTRDTTLGTNGRATLISAATEQPGIATILPDGNYLLALQYGSGGLTKFTAAIPFALGSGTGTLTFEKLPDSGDETITVTQSSGRDRVTYNGQTTTYAAGSIKAIDASLGDGTNHFTSTLDVPTTVNGGLGADYVTTGDNRDLIRLDPNDYTTDAPDGYALVNSGGGYDTIVPGPPGTRGYDLNLGTGGGTVYGNYSTVGATTVTGSGRGKWDIAASGKFFNVTLAGSGPRAEINGAGATRGRIDLSAFTGLTNVTGTRGDDVILTGPGDDNVAPLGGNDTVTTGAGNDTVYGDYNDDDGLFNLGNVNADESVLNLNDVIDTGPGNDRINDVYGNNTVVAGDGNDRIVTGDGRDSIQSNAGRDIVLAGDNNDTADGGAGDDTLDGEAGNDKLYGGSGDDTVIGGIGNDTLKGNAGNDNLYAGVPDAGLRNRAKNIVDGGSGEDSLRVESTDDDDESIETLIGLP